MGTGSRDPSNVRHDGPRPAPRGFRAEPEDGLTPETLRETVKIVGFDPVPGCRGLCAHLLPG